MGFYQGIKRQFLVCVRFTVEVSYNVAEYFLRKTTLENYKLWSVDFLVESKFELEDGQTDSEKVARGSSCDVSGATSQSC